ncbi:MAG: TetR/AcrR family transcriptional regulator [Candidatus Bathyarchaeia archaeon]
MADRQSSTQDGTYLRIKKAAKRVFSRKGYFGATVEEIAREAGIAKGTIYLYFKGKDHLYVSSMITRVNEFTKVLERFRDEVREGKFKSGGEIIERFYSIFSDLYKHDVDSLRIYQVFYLIDLWKFIDKNVSKDHLASARRNGKIAAEIVEMAIQQGLLPKMIPVQLVSILWSSFLGIVQVESSKTRMGGSDHVLETVKTCYSIIAEGLDKILKQGGSAHA